MNKALLKKHMPLLVTGGVILALMLVIVWQLIVTARNFNQEKHQLQSVTARLAQLNNRDPFPSEDNVRQARANLDELVDMFNELNDRLREGQVEPQSMEAAQFMPLLENTLRRLRSAFRSNQVALPQRFAFGFERYAEGQLPDPEAIPRMVQQLRIIEQLCRTAVDARVSELINITREEFEGSREASVSRRRGRGEQAPDVRHAPDFPEAQGPDADLFSSQRFVLTLRGPEGAVMDFLVRLASLPMFAVVTSVDMQNRRRDARDTARSAPPADEPAAAVPHERRVIIGREEIDVTVAVVVYQFEPSLDFNTVL